MGLYKLYKVDVTARDEYQSEALEKDTTPTEKMHLECEDIHITFSLGGVAFLGFPDHLLFPGPSD